MANQSKKYPEHEKMAAVRVQADAIGAFLETLGEHGQEIARAHEHSDGCMDRWGYPQCGWNEGELEPIRMSIERRLAAYLNIDLDKISAEKDEMLKEIRDARGD
jgi:hypothetical protein